MEANPDTIRLDELLAHSTWVRSLALRLLGDASSADDVVQDTWLAAMTSPPRERIDLRAWLGKVVRNAARQRARGGARRTQREKRVAEERESVTSPDELAERVETQRRVAGLVLALEEPFRQTLLLRFYEGLSSAEIARRTDVPAGTVRWRLKRGLDDLRERLDGDYGSRRAWCLALVPLARGGRAAPLPAASSGAGAPVLLQGFLTMNVVSKVALVAALLSVPFLYRMLVGPSSEPLRASGMTELAFRPVATAADDDERASRSSSSAAVEREPARAAGSPRGASASAAVDGPGATARILDPSGRPISGALARFRGYGETETRADDAGIATIHAPEDWQASIPGEFVVDVEGYLLEERTFNLSEDSLVDLGDVTLRLAGRIEGRVVDAQGRPVADAWVHSERSMRQDPTRDDAVDYSTDDRSGIRTNDLGDFVLPREEPGVALVWAGRAGLLAGCEPGVEVRGGHVTSGVVVQLGELEPTDLIRGRVVGPDGLPIARAHVDGDYRKAGRSGSHGVTADADGRFALPFTRRIPHTLHVTDPKGRYAAATLTDVVGAPEERVIRLGEATLAEVLLRSGGAALSEDAARSATLAVLRVDRRRPLVEPDAIAREGAALRFPLPEVDFLLIVTADGFDATELGPFPGRSAPRSIACDLAPLPRVTGVVLADGEPVEGATVSFHRAVATFTERNGYPVRHDDDPRVTATTAAEGAFAATVRESGAYYVRADHPGHASAELGPIDIDKDAGAAGLALELTAGGVIEGTLHPANDESPAGRVVAISRGDNRARTARVGADGSYRFERLMPGRWLVTTRDEELVSGRSSSSSSMAPFDESFIQSNCEVRAGEVTRFDLDLAGEAAVPHLVGSLTIDGEPAVGWRYMTASIQGGPQVFAIAGPPPVIGPSGEFEVDQDVPGPYRLSLNAPGETGRPGITLAIDLELARGINTFARSFATGTVVVENARPVSEYGIPLDYLVMRVEGMDVLAPVVRDEGTTTATIELVPTGRAKLMRFDIQELATLSAFPLEREALVEVDVVAGGSATVELP